MHSGPPYRHNFRFHLFAQCSTMQTLDWSVLYTQNSLGRDCCWLMCDLNNGDDLILLQIKSLKAHTHQAIHDHADHIFDRSPIGMRHWDVHELQSALRLTDCSTDLYKTCTFQCLIPVGDLSEI